MLRVQTLVLSFVVGVSLVITCSPAWAEDCGSAAGDAAIAVCTRDIDSGKFKRQALAVRYYSRGVEYSKKGDNDRAIADYDQAIVLDSKYAAAFNNRGLAYANKGDHGRAIADYNQAIRFDPKSVHAFNNRGNSYKYKGDSDRAIADYNQAIILDPKFAMAFSNRGTVYSNKGDNDRAVDDYNQAISLNPKSANTFNNRGIAYSDKGDSDRAIADYNQAISLDPQNGKAYLNRGDAYRDKGDAEHAIADYTEAINLKYEAAFDARAAIYLAKGEYERSIAGYTQAIGVEPKAAWYYFGRGRANFYAGFKDKALADLVQASALAPTRAYYPLWIEIFAQRNNAPSGLAEASSKVDLTVWPAPVVKYFLGQISFEDLLAAADDSNALKKKGRVCETNFYAGELALSKKTRDEAIRLFRLAASDCPHSFIEWALPTPNCGLLVPPPVSPPFRESSPAFLDCSAEPSRRKSRYQGRRNEPRCRSAAAHLGARQTGRATCKREGCARTTVISGVQHHEADDWPQRKERRARCRGGLGCRSVRGSANTHR